MIYAGTNRTYNPRIDRLPWCSEDTPSIDGEGPGVLFPTNQDNWASQQDPSNRLRALAQREAAKDRDSEGQDQEYGRLLRLDHAWASSCKLPPRSSREPQELAQFKSLEQKGGGGRRIDRPRMEARQHSGQTYPIMHIVVHWYISIDNPHQKVSIAHL